jgi:hypothetical protein
MGWGGCFAALDKGDPFVGQLSLALIAVAAAETQAIGIPFAYSLALSTGLLELDTRCGDLPTMHLASLDIERGRAARAQPSPHVDR